VPPLTGRRQRRGDAYGKLKKKKVTCGCVHFEGQVIDSRAKDIEDEVESVPSTPNSSDNEQVDEESV